MGRKQRISYVQPEDMDEGSLGLVHHEVLAGTAASMAPGFGTAAELAASKESPGYWAKAPSA